ncbi:unnamed protein product [Adineta steineri]|uniref:cysteine desulfurase n=1 Tax=Adineta steineri TaxID=433720 RepID=A0A814FFK5_9BILA|nr:unnamed protein product [Adineta steineri]CAF0982187.1 unnamed protein product [Adineta steineri]CAF3494643.1 unnamed protein product [Adineta steineri]CAF3512609.1 unnamed protein product [Adineta steineri]
MALLSMNNDLHEEYNHTSKIIYLDNNATTREDKSVIEIMINHLKRSNSFGNPSSSHLIGIETRYLIDESREQIRSSINALYSNEIIFTSGGTESNNLAIHGILKSNLNNHIQHIITSPFEHPSVANLLTYLQNSYEKIEISFVKVDSNGIIDLQHFRQLLKPETKLVTIMHSNNEIGSIQPIEEIVQLCRKYGSSDILIHTDASQSMGKVAIDVLRLDIDLLTICSHKFHGPKGIGALYIRQGIKLEPILYGAQHEQNLRPGTENVLAIVGLGKACQLISNKSILNKRIEQMKRTRDRLYLGLKNQFNDQNQDFLKRNGIDQYCLPNTLSLSFQQINARQLVKQLSDSIAFSTGSACHEDTKHQTMSTTLQAIGLSWELARGTIRLSTSYMTTDDEIDQSIILITNAIKQQLSSYTDQHD